jgi:hypothetical protein
MITKNEEKYIFYAELKRVDIRTQPLWMICTARLCVIVRCMHLNFSEIVIQIHQRQWCRKIKK